MYHTKLASTAKARVFSRDQTPETYLEFARAWRFSSHEKLKPMHLRLVVNDNLIETLSA